VRAGLQPFQHLDTPDAKRRIHESGVAGRGLSAECGIQERLGSRGDHPFVCRGQPESRDHAQGVTGQFIGGPDAAR